MAPASISTVAAFALLTSLFALTQDASDKTAICRFESGEAISVRYKKTDKTTPPAGKVWSPAGTPMFLFTDTPVQIGGATLGVRAYSMYVIAGKEGWTLVVNESVDANQQYDKSKDVVRIPMQAAELSNPRKTFNVILGRVAPKQCNMRIYTGDVGVFGAEFKEQ